MDAPGSVPIKHRTELFTTADLRLGALAGLAGGLVMGLLAMLIATLYGQELDLWVPIKQVAATAYGEVAMDPGFALGPVVIGTLIHFLVAAILGVLFAVIYRRILRLPFQLGLPFLVGGIYGLAIWGIAHLLLPSLNPVMAEADKPAFVLGHIAFGVTIGVVYAQLHLRAAGGIVNPQPT
jgi:hypothetical protein